jgi:hypothetical protein
MLCHRVASRHRAREIKTDIRKAKWQLSLAWTARALGWMSLISVVAKPIRKQASNALAVRRSEVATLDANLAATTISVNFDMDSEVAEPHQRMQAAFDGMASSQRAWSVQTTQRIAPAWAPAESDIATQARHSRQCDKFSVHPRTPFPYRSE